MFGRMAVIALAIGLAGCAGLEPAGRNAGRTPSASAPPASEEPAQTSPPAQIPAPVAATPAPTQATPTPQAAAPTPAPAAAQEEAAPPPQQRAQAGDDDIVVPGQVQTQVPPPAGDPRTNEERRADIRAWDQCVMQVQSAFDSDPMNPQLTSPEEYCATSLGMADRTAVPVSRSQRRR